MDCRRCFGVAVIALGSILALDVAAMREGEGAPVHARGAPDAPVTLVEYTDFQCPFCLRVLPAIERLMDEYPGKVRWVVRHFPLGFHQDAGLAHEAALAAGAQGRFWGMHDLLFANPRRLKRPDLMEYARELGLDLGRFDEDLDQRRFRPVVQAHIREGQAAGVSGTPTIFINGTRLGGAKPYSTFKAHVDAALGLGPPPEMQTAPAIDPGALELTAGAGAVRGDPAAPLTVHAFFDLQCPFCKKAVPVLDELLDRYAGQVRVAFKHYPLPFHAGARPAHTALLAAGEQGRFWEMHDRLIANQGALKPQDLRRYAAELGLDLDRFERDLRSARFQRIIDRDMAEGERAGVRGTPTFFIGETRLSGARPLAAFTEAVDRELARVDPAAGALAPAPRTTLGPDEAPVKIAVFGDFQSRLSAHAAGILRQAVAAAPERVQLTFRHLPMAYRANAYLPHEAALAAAEQGRFWEMHDAIFRHRGAISRERLIEIAAELRLDAERLVAALDEGRHRHRVKQDIAAARRRGIRGVPTILVNDTRIDGIPERRQLDRLIEAATAAGRSAEG